MRAITTARPVAPSRYDWTTYEPQAMFTAARTGTRNWTTRCRSSQAAIPAGVSGVGSAAVPYLDLDAALVGLLGEPADPKD
ncbi:hypothetical protein [Micromonospora sp. MA102]|uniref:hypothetical protein n=1 Tax=Micromonospora sp. MA102 TaxID=2952755 RepID=UPI0021C5FA86|nr:hypothetical protein [Micromonospora sp. MA102]